MAQGQASVAEPYASRVPENASAQDLKALRNYDKITQLRDAILAGTHPTIKLPQGVAASKWSPSGSKEASRSTAALRARPSQQTSASAEAILSGSQPATAPQHATATSSYEARTADINPLFLQKSDELIKAEFRVQRKRLEQALAEEWAQHRFKQDYQESYSDQDLTGFLLKALGVVQASNPAPAVAPAAEGHTANDEAASDSFDNDTFYSSKHPTPESNLTSRVRNDSEEIKASQPSENRVAPASNAPAPLYEQTSHLGHSHYGHGSGHVSPPHPFHVQATARPKDLPMAPAPFQVPGLNNYTEQTDKALHMTGSQQQTLPAGSSASHITGSGQPYRNAQEHLDDSYVENHPPSPLVRGEDIVPAPVQPVQVPSYTAEGYQAPAAELRVKTPRGAPAQVTALRNEPVSVDSPESSPQSGKERKRTKKKKRKADRQGPEEIMPYIKPEPRSPSPMTAPSYIRPQKRRRQATRSGNNSDQDEVMIPAPPPQHHVSSYQDPVPAGYAIPHGYPQRAASAAVAPAPRYYDGGYGSEQVYAHQPPPSRYVERQPSVAYARPPPHVLADDRYSQPQPIYRERYETSRMSVRPDTDPYVGQPMPPPQPQRVYVDSSGREYLEPSRAPARQSVAPPTRELVYEQPLPRAVSRYPGYDEDREVIYAQPPPAYSGPRRVVTQPEYTSRGYVEPPREYPGGPGGAPPTEYVPTMAPPSNHHGGLPPEDYRREGSVRPPGAIRYYERIQSTRPEAPPHLPRHPESYRVEYAPQPPAEAPGHYQGYSTRPPEPYHGQPPVRQGDEQAYVERPGGAAHGVVYANGGRREAYP